MSEAVSEARLWPKSGRDLAATLALAIAYFAAGKLGLRLAVVHPSATAVWAPTGIALAAFLRWGFRLWPGVYAGAFLVNLTTAGTVATSIGIATGNTLEGLVAAALIRRFAGGDEAFDRAIGVFWYVTLGGLLATTISPTIGLTSLAAGGFARSSDYGAIWLTWWLGDASGALVVAPALILWTSGGREVWNRRRTVEAGALAIVLLSIGLLLFSEGSTLATRHYPLQFLLGPPLLWAAFRFGPRGAATATFLLFAIESWGTTHGLGPFAALPPAQALLILQAFLDVWAVTTLVVAALVSERARAIRARDDILSVAGHELRTPLSTLTLQVENLSRGLRLGAPAETLQARTESVRRSSRRLATLVDDMLHVSRVTSGVIPVHLERIELAVFTREATNHFLDQLSTAEVRVEVEASEAVWTRTDPERLASVFGNLLGNAIKYGLGRPIAIAVTRQDRVARLSVRDQGAGISREDQRRIFERFERAASASHVSGFGLGLWIARQTLEALGGKIHVQSAPGEGSTFWVELPLAEKPDNSPGA